MEPEKIKQALDLKNDIEDLIKIYEDDTEGHPIRAIIMSLYIYLENLYMCYCVDEKDRDRMARLIKVAEGEYPKPKKQITEEEIEWIREIFHKAYICHVSMIERMRRC
jgi:hypothetical protein